MAALEKKAKNIEKVQAEAEKAREKLADTERKRNTIEERLNCTKPLDDRKERESEFKCENEEDQAIIQDKNTSPSEREA